MTHAARESSGPMRRHRRPRGAKPLHISKENMHHSFSWESAAHKELTDSGKRARSLAKKHGVRPARASHVDGLKKGVWTPEAKVHARIEAKKRRATLMKRLENARRALAGDPKALARLPPKLRAWIVKHYGKGARKSSSGKSSARGRTTRRRSRR